MAQTTATPRWAIVEAPSVLGLKPTGVDGLAAALLRHGLADRLGARVAARLTPPPYEPVRRQDTGTSTRTASRGSRPRSPMPSAT